MKLVNIYKVYHNKRNNVEALKGINLEVNKNGLIFLLGSSGCGKTTLLNIISGRDKDFEGECLDVPVREYLTQEFDLFENMSVINNLLLVKEDPDIIDHYLKEFDLWEHKDKQVKKCSNGQKKRVQFIRALLNHPGLLLCDEPTAALDHDNAEILMHHLQRISQDVQIIIVTHDIALAEKYGDRIIRMNKGIIVSDEIRTSKISASSGEEIKKKNIKETMQLVLREIKSRIVENIFLTCLILASILVVFTTFNLYTTIKNQTDYLDAIKISRTLVLSLPNDETVIKEQEEYESMHFDFYQYTDILTVIEQNPDILAVEAYYDDYLKPEILIESIYIFNISPNVFKSFELSTGYETSEFSNFGTYNLPNSQTFLLSSRDIIGMNDYEEQVKRSTTNSYHCDLKSYCFDFGKIKTDYQLNLFDIINGYDIPMLTGSLPQKKNEVLLARDTADMLIRLEDEYETYEDLIGKQMVIGAEGRKNTFDQSSYYEDEDASLVEQIPVTITGVSAIENDHMNMVFFNNGFAKNAVMDHFVEKYDDLFFEYVRFILRPGSDIKTFVNEVNSAVPQDKSSFSLFGGEGLGRNLVYYQSPESFMIYCISIIGIILAIIILVNMFIRKRIQKEQAIMHHYGYSIQQERILRIGVLLFFASVTALCISKPFCESVNDYARSLYYDKFMSFDMIWILLSALAVGAVFILCESVIGGKRHD